MAAAAAAAEADLWLRFRLSKDCITVNRGNHRLRLSCWAVPVNE